MQNNEKNYEGAESEEAKNNKDKTKQKKTYSIAKNNLVKSHSFTTSAKLKKKSLNFGQPPQF